MATLMERVGKEHAPRLFFVRVICPSELGFLVLVYVVDIAERAGVRNVHGAHYFMEETSLCVSVCAQQ